VDDSISDRRIWVHDKLRQHLWVLEGERLLDWSGESSSRRCTICGALWRVSAGNSLVAYENWDNKRK
jgi:hypothetical protein